MDIFTQKESNVQSYANNFPVVFSTAKGSHLYTKEGDAYLDFLAGAGSLNYGHNNDILKQALLEYIEQDGLTHGLDMHSDAKAQFLLAMQRYIFAPRRLDYKVQFTGPTGTNAVEAAIKLARKVTGRTNIVSFTNGFHGCSLGALAVTGNQHHRGGAGMSLNGVTRIPYEGYADTDGLSLFSAMLDDNSSGLDKPAGVIVEVVQGEGGLNAASPQWLRRLSDICKQHDILLIVDDIQAGCGRTGTFFSFEPAEIKPDIVTLSKSIGGYGLPLAVVLYKPQYDVWKPGEHNGTFRGNNHAFVTAAKALETYWADDKFAQHIDQRASQVTQCIEKVSQQYSSLFNGVKGRGLMQGIECLDGDVAHQITQECFHQGMVIETAGPDDEVIKFFCPLTITASELDKGLAIFKSAVDKVAPRLIKQAS
ncbi:MULTISPECIES: diaminobutyrate--2-oxoglutarate transaminase [Vibrio]|uniref:Diaminobutyrate--2-oxoglutarate transaminase n=2 Tax=Vibrio TaxID=662 RepID=A0A7X4LJA8_9VIBR|nr:MULTISPECIES: diaminobutyrate--2-oxoglutarate transaminase [Vibrio]MBF9002823.1 diaminobutyrate--2-oxoglutarate transaminase [Vibrio nitrifigilis]MZI92957.1 diaminobutyrate--2-oxoglutarate transaminase [Vibrio eleionomae]